MPLTLNRIMSIHLIRTRVPWIKTDSKLEETDRTRWYLRGIQTLVSTYVLDQCKDLPKFELGGVGFLVFWGSQN